MHSKIQAWVGLTGGIGSGKSYVGNLLQHMGYPVFQSDVIAKGLLHDDIQVRDAIIHLLGEEILDNQGEIEKNKLSKILFNRKEIRLKINEIIHPVVRAKFIEWSAKQSSTLVFNEAAILYETGAFKNFDAMVLVTAPMSMRLKRIMLRDKCTEELAQARINAQWTDDQKLAFQPHLIVNDETSPLLIQIEEVLKMLGEDS